MALATETDHRAAPLLGSRIMATNGAAGRAGGWWLVALPVILLAFTATGRDLEPTPIEDLALSGRVVEFESRKPIAGAEVSLGANDLWGVPLKPDEVATSDADGRFTLRIRPDREGERRPAVIVRVRHRDHIARQSLQHTVAELRQEAARGAQPFFDSIEMERGEEYRIRVVTPEDEPAAGVVMRLNSDRYSTISSLFYDDFRGTSDAAGRVRIRMLKPSVINGYTFSERFAQVAYTFNSNDRRRYPGGALPNDLGTIILSRGQSISGRVVDLDGRPIAGVHVQIPIPQSGVREAHSDASGAFRIDALAPGGYMISANSRHTIGRPEPGFAYPIGPEYVQFDSGGEGATVELKEVRSVAVAARFVDAKGRPVPGCPVAIYGQIPAARAAAAVRIPGDFAEAELALLEDPAARPGLNAPFRAIFGNLARRAQVRQNMQLQWSMQVETDSEGRAVARVPKGLINASIRAHDPSGSMLFMTRPKADSQAMVGFVQLGVLNEDPAPIEFLALRPARLTVRILMEEGGMMPEDINVQARNLTKGRNRGGCSGQRGADGLHRVAGLVPDQPYSVYANANGFLPAWAEGVSLPEGGSRELTLTLSRTPVAAKVGDLAPQILVATLDGEARSLADYQGRFVLVTIWSARQTPDAATKMKAIRDRFRGDDRLALLGLSYDSDREVIEALVKERKVDWPQARMGSDSSRIVAVYGCTNYPNSFLIGPDGMIVALNLGEDAVEAAVAKALKK